MLIEDSLEDVGHEQLPALIEHGKTFTWEHEGYWKDMGRAEPYLSAHRRWSDKVL